MEKNLARGIWPSTCLWNAALPRKRYVSPKQLLLSFMSYKELVCLHPSQISLWRLQKSRRCKRTGQEKHSLSFFLSFTTGLSSRISLQRMRFCCHKEVTLVHWRLGVNVLHSQKPARNIFPDMEILTCPVQDPIGWMDCRNCITLCRALLSQQLYSYAELWDIVVQIAQHVWKYFMCIKNGTIWLFQKELNRIILFFFNLSFPSFFFSPQLFINSIHNLHGMNCKCNHQHE